MSLEEKLDAVLKAVTMLNERISAIDSKLDSFDARLNELDDRFSVKLAELEKSISSKVSAPDLDALTARITKLEQQNMDLQNEALMQESYSKRFNILIHGIEESTAWENREQTRQLIDQFLTEGLKIHNPDSIHILDYHRLPQRPIFKQGQKVTRPIIIKLCNAADKHKIFRSLKNLKEYNEDRRLRNNFARNVFITEHLPKPFQEQRKRLLPFFNQARKENKKTMWRVEQNEYALYVDNKRVNVSSE